MDYFNYHNDTLFAENLAVKELAEKFDTPLYIYSKAALEQHMNAFEQALKGRRHLICYAVKANSSLAILNLMASRGSGFDVVSEGELRKVLAAGGRAASCVFSGVGKKQSEIEFALKKGILCLNIESIPEVKVISDTARALGVKAPVAVRVNPDVDAKTHPAISTGLKENKFGIDLNLAKDLYRQMAADPNLNIVGIDCHIGSQMVTKEPIAEAVDKLLALYEELKGLGISIDHIDIGGGLGVTYSDETPPTPSEYLQAVLQKITDDNLAIYVEPGRAIAANAGILVTKVLYLKEQESRNFCIVDAGMNDLIRPALYNSWMNIIEAIRGTGDKVTYDVVGPVCESDDFLGKDRKLAVSPGDYLVVKGAGAYGFSMASTYNSRPLPCEIMVSANKAKIIRKRQSFSDLISCESLLED